MTWASAFLTALLIAIAFPALAARDTLLLGVLPSDCRSVLAVGIELCRQRDSDRDHFNAATEAQVAEYLAQYGKPPLEAVRALIDPSDANIAAWLRQQRRAISIASYVATRMTEMQSQIDPAIQSVQWLPLAKEAATIQMRVTLYLEANSTASLQSIEALQRVAFHYPSLDARLAYVGPIDEDSVPSWLRTFNIVLPVSYLGPDAITGHPLPSLLIEDLRTRRSRRIDASEITSQQICDLLLRIREASD